MLFANQSIDYSKRYIVVRETSMYLFLQEVTKDPNFIFRIHKNTWNVKGIKEGKDGYRWDVPSAIQLKKIEDNGNPI